MGSDIGRWRGTGRKTPVTWRSPSQRSKATGWKRAGFNDALDVAKAAPNVAMLHK
jgi:hypothetical protein